MSAAATLQVSAYGPGAYLKSGWNVLDVTIVLISLADQLLPSSLSSVRLLRVLRPMRLLAKVC